MAILMTVDASYPCRDDAGFTLIEMMISISMGLIIFAGLTTMFSSMNNASRSISSRGDRMGDLYLASHIMQSELRGSKKVCVDISSSHYRVIYQPIDSNVAPDVSGSCNTGAIDGGNGSFEMRDATPTHPTPYICWNRPLKNDNCQELIRDLYPRAANPPSPGVIIGLDVVPPAGGASAGIWTVTMTAKYLNESKNAMPLSLRFKIWPRN